MAMSVDTVDSCLCLSDAHADWQRLVAT